MWHYALSWDSSPEDVLVAASGVVTPATVAAFTREALADPRFRSGLLVLIDYRDADLAQLTGADLDERLAMMTRDAPPFAGSKLAIVVSRAVDFGVMRMLHQRGDLVLEQAGLDVERHVFRTIEEARVWLARFAGSGAAESEQPPVSNGLGPRSTAARRPLK